MTIILDTEDMKYRIFLLTIILWFIFYLIQIFMTPRYRFSNFMEILPNISFETGKKFGCENIIELPSFTQGKNK